MTRKLGGAVRQPEKDRRRRDFLRRSRDPSAAPDGRSTTSRILGAPNAFYERLLQALYEDPAPKPAGPRDEPTEPPSRTAEPHPGKVSNREDAQAPAAAAVPEPARGQSRTEDDEASAEPSGSGGLVRWLWGHLNPKGRSDWGDEASFVPTISPRRQFNRAKEFPNYFLPPGVRNAPSARVSKKVVEASRESLEAAMESIFRRLLLPIPGDNGLELVRFFERADAVVKGIDKNAHVMPAAGVVRAVWAHLYREMYEGMCRVPAVSPDVTLSRIAQAEDDVNPFEALGLTSDVDLLVESPAGRSAEIGEALQALTNRAALDHGDGKLGDPKVRLFYVVGDVHEYSAQIRRSQHHGGCTLDWLAFDRRTNSLREPENAKGIVFDALKGRLRYAEPAGKVRPDERNVTLSRAFRHPVELPSMSFEEGGNFTRELKRFIAQLRSGYSPSDPEKGKIKKQIEKAGQNAYRGGANNAYYRAAPGTNDARVGEILPKLGPAIGRTIPEFIDAVPIESRVEERHELNGLPRELLMPIETFLESHTADRKGRIFHGTKHFMNTLSMGLHGFILSRTGQGSAAHRRGFYATKDREVAQERARGGYICELRVLNDPRINVLDWEDPRVHRHQFIIDLKARAKEEGRDEFEMLARDHGIDIIRNTHLLIQNADVVAFTADLEEFARVFSTRLENKQLPLKEREAALSSYTKLHAFAVKLGISDLKTPAEFAELVLRPELEKTIQDLLQGKRDRIRSFKWYRRLYRSAERAGLANLKTPEQVALWVVQDMGLNGALAKAKNEKLSTSERVAGLEKYTKAHRVAVALGVSGLVPPSKVGEDLCRAEQERLKAVLEDEGRSSHARVQAVRDFLKLERLIRTLKLPYPHSVKRAASYALSDAISERHEALNQAQAYYQRTKTEYDNAARRDPYRGRPMTSAEVNSLIARGQYRDPPRYHLVEHAGDGLGRARGELSELQSLARTLQARR